MFIARPVRSTAMAAAVGGPSGIYSIVDDEPSPARARFASWRTGSAEAAAASPS
jgi:hypothetical protein